MEPISGLVSPPCSLRNKRATLGGTKAQLDQPVRVREGEEGERALKKDLTDKISDLSKSKLYKHDHARGKEIKKSKTIQQLADLSAHDLIYMDIIIIIGCFIQKNFITDIPVMPHNR